MLFEDFVDSSELLIKSVLASEKKPKDLERFVKDSLLTVKSLPEGATERFKTFCGYFLGISKLPQNRIKTRLNNGLIMIEKLRRENLTGLPAIPQKSVDLGSDVKFAKKVGPSRAEKLNRLGIMTIRELLYHFPRLYDDWRRPLNILKLRPGERVSAIANIVNVEKRRAKNYTIVTVIVTDGFSNMHLVWFNQEYIYNLVRNAKRIAFSGIVKNDYGRFQVMSPDFEIADSASPRIAPIYDLTAGISQKMMRMMIESNISHVHSFEDPIPEDILKKRNLLDVKRSVYGIHFPQSEYHLKESKRRLAYEELFLLEVSQLMIRKKFQSKGGVPKRFKGTASEKFKRTLPFELTEAQKKAIEEIEKDLAGSFVMNRLLQGDVGSGKTVVAEIAILDVIESGFQATFMAPTYVLASQHYERIKSDLSPFGIEIELLTGSTPSNKKTEIKEKISKGEIQLVIGTHALIQKDVSFQNLGLVIIDEQHKFGVKQREALMSKGKAVDTLVMTATPIPRTLSMTLYGDLDVTLIDELPKGRKKPKTMLVNENKRDDVIDFVKKEIDDGNGVFWISPLIEESEKLDLKAAKEIYEEFVKGPFSKYNVGLLHGKMPSEEKEKVMNQFYRKEIQVLVSTTVIEVGIDISHANVMVIEHPERFGLAQLHQLRGRIGRGGEKSYCFLLTNGVEIERLRYFVHTFDGFALAEYDLKLRGPGEFMGTRQHGIPEFKVANLSEDMDLLLQAREDAEKLVESDPELSSHPVLLKEINRRYGERVNFVEVG